MPRGSEINTTSACGIEECKKLIPVFNPSSEGVLCATDWLANVQTVKNMFHWNDSATLFYAALRLEEAASSWFMTIRRDNLTWNEFKSLLVQAFPAAADNTQVYVKLMQRTKKADESIEKYFYDVVALARQGNFNEEATRNFVVSGLIDKELISAVTGSITQCSTTQDLLGQIKVHINVLEQQRARNKFTNVNNNGNKNGTSDQVSTRYSKPFVGNAQGKRQENRTCFNCRQVGHIARDCRKRKVFSNFNKNMNNPGVSAKIAKISINKNSGLIKDVTIGNHTLEAFLDLGSECSTIKLNKLKELAWNFEKSNVKLTGFGGNTVSALGRINKSVKIQDVAIDIDIFVVNDNYQEYDMIIGQNYLDYPGVRCVRENGQLNLTYKAAIPI